MTGLTRAPGGGAHHYRAADFEALVDSPILAGALEVREFLDGCKHYLATGPVGAWDGDRAVRDLEKMAQATRRFWGSLPFEQYLFLIAFRQGGGGLEHRNSTMVTSSPTRSGTPEGYRAWLGLVSHEYFHA